MIYELYCNFQHTRSMKAAADALAAIVRPHNLDARRFRRFYWRRLTHGVPQGSTVQIILGFKPRSDLFDHFPPVCIDY